MDSLTQAAFGAAIAGAVAPRGHRRKALLLGAVLGTVPDLDVFIDYGGAVENFTMHRGFSHSLFVLSPLSLVLWWALKRLWRPASEAPLRWLAVIALALLTHPLLDAHTAYGTQLFWPLEPPPAMWATLFIIDPLFTLPLLVAAVVTALAPARRWSSPLLRGAVALSVAYVAWSWVAQGLVRHRAEQALVASGRRDAPVFIVPTPFNTVVWRIVALNEKGYLEGFASVLRPRRTVEFREYPSDTAALEDAGDIWAVKRLRWFSRDFMKAEVREGRLLLSDLRMGQEPYYVFTHAVAEEGNPHWGAIPTELVPFEYDRRLLLGELRRHWTH